MNSKVFLFQYKIKKHLKIDDKRAHYYALIGLARDGEFYMAESHSPLPGMYPLTLPLPICPAHPEPKNSQHLHMSTPNPEPVQPAEDPKTELTADPEPKSPSLPLPRVFR